MTSSGPTRLRLRIWMSRESQFDPQKKHLNLNHNKHVNFVKTGAE